MDSVHNAQKITIEPPSNEPHEKNEGKTFFPRTHSHKNISRAKIKTVKLTVAVIAGYILCSAPFVCVQLYAIFGSPSQGMRKSLIYSVQNAFKSPSWKPFVSLTSHKDIQGANFTMERF